MGISLQPSRPKCHVLLLCAYFLAFFWLTPPVSANDDYAKTAVTDGVLKLDDRALGDVLPLELKGSWQVIWGKLVSPDEFDQHYQGHTFSIPSRWNDVDVAGWQGAKGVATFRMWLRLPKYDGELDFHTIAAHSAYRVFIDGELAVENGIVSDDPTVFKQNQVSRRFAAQDGESELIMQVANFTHAFGGPGHALTLWDRHKLSRMLDILSVVYGLVAGVLFAIALFHLILFLADHKDQNSAIHLWFSILCFIIVYRVQGINPLLHEYFPNSDYWNDLRLPYASLYAAPAAYLLFFRAVFREQFPDKLTLAIVGISVAMLAFTLVTSEFTYTSTRNFAIWLNVFVIAYSLWFTGAAVRASQPGAWTILIANFVFLVTAIYDAIIYTDRSSGFDLTPFGILVLGIGYSYALFVRLQNTFKKARQTSRALETLNAELETQVKDRTSAFQAAAAKAENAAREKARFIAAASHDLRQPLHALSLFNAALKQKSSDAGPAEILHRQESAISNLGAMLQDTLDTAMLDVQAKSIKLASVAVADIKSALLDNFAEPALSTGIVLTVKADEGEIVTDGTMLQRILGNLMDNALRAADKTIEVQFLRQAQQWTISVTNDGEGIPQVDAERIFDSYVSTRKNSSAHKGFGLGLYVVKEFTEALGGQVEMDSPNQQGAVFTLTLPSHPAEPSSASAVTAETFELHRLAGLRVLVVDDDAIVVDAVRLLLEEWQCQVEVATKARAAREKALSFEPELLLLDYHLNAIDGLTLRNELQEQMQTKLPTIIITGATEPEILTAIERNNLRILQKPVEAHQLGTAIVEELGAKPTLL